MISACDIRLATEDAVFCLKEAAIGLVADMGVLQRLPKNRRPGFAREMPTPRPTTRRGKSRKRVVERHLSRSGKPHGRS